MTLHSSDWLVIALYFLISIAIALVVSKRAGRSTGDFFLSGRSLPWWIAGTSMVATTFAADTPLTVTELIAQNGIAGNWLWWNMIIGGMLTVFFFARLWRRAGILTDCEFAAIRYSGRGAAFLRALRAVYIGIFMNCIVIAWVNLAMVKILTVVFPNLTIFGHSTFSIPGFSFSSHLVAVAGLMLFVAFYSAISGLWGITITDAFQFLTAMAGCIILAFYALGSDDIGGIAGLRDKLPEWVFKFTPDVGGGASEGAGTAGLLKMSLLTFVTYLCVQWWASWYPGAEPGGGGYIAQRMMSAKNERHAVLATLWFNVAHYALRPWPWIIVALCSLVMYPQLGADQKGQGFVMAIGDLLPPGLVGLLLAAFLAAYMSTISTQLNWGCSYIINDLYHPFIRPGADEKYYVRVSRITTFVLMVLSVFVTSKMTRISDAWKFCLECSGGIGLVLILRWFWWRINAFSEIAAMTVPFVIYPVLKYGLGPPLAVFPNSLLIIVAFSTLAWLTVTFLTRPTNEATLLHFYRKVHPGGLLWRPVAGKLPDVKGDKGFALLLIDWLAGCVCVMFSLLGVGKIIFGELKLGLLLLAAAAFAGSVIYRHLSRTGSEDTADKQL